MLGQRQAKTGAFDAGPFRAEPVERREEPIELVRRDAVAGVPHEDPQAFAQYLFTRHRDGPPGPVVLHGVREEVQEDLLEPLPVGQDVLALVGGARVERDPVLGREGADDVESAAQGLAHRDRLQRELQAPGLDLSS